MYGRRSKKLDPDQLQLGLEDLEQSIGMAEAAQDAADARKPDGERRAATSRRNRGNLPKPCRSRRSSSRRRARLVPAVAMRCMSSARRRASRSTSSRPSSR
jgi:hypothetical protein